MANREKIIELLKTKTSIKQEVYDISIEVFNRLKNTLQEYAVEMNETLEGEDRRVKMAYQDRGKFEAQVQVASDILLFVMHTNVFKYDQNNPIEGAINVGDDPLDAYFGVINVYNFLSDSFKHNRSSDTGHLVLRVLVNRKLHFMVEGETQIVRGFEDIAQNKLSSESLIEILERVLLYVIDEFELLVPHYTADSHVSVEQFNTKSEHSLLKVAKRPSR